jgi:hypothetical protein
MMEALETPYDSIEQVLDSFERLERSLYDRRDRRAVFATTYLTMTREIGERVVHHDFHDAEWVGRYAIAFANLYRVALLAYERGEREAVARPWQISFDTSSASENLLLQDMLLGVNAHINHDLAIALVEVGIDTRREERRADHFAVNEAIRHATEAVQKRFAGLYAPVYRLLDHLLGDFDADVANFSIEKARLNAWISAVSLAGARSEEERGLVLRSISDQATVMANLILLPTRRSRLLALRRRLEGPLSRWGLLREGF